MFHCTRCGYCCRSLAGVDLFQGLDRGDGVCKYLNEKTNLCEIYENRPLLCRVDESYDAYFREDMSQEDYERLNYESCLALKARFEKQT